MGHVDSYHDGQVVRGQFCCILLVVLVCSAWKQVRSAAGGEGFLVWLVCCVR